MSAMRAVGNGHHPLPTAQVRESNGDYVIDLDVSNFTKHELKVEVAGPRITVRGDQVEIAEDAVASFRLHARLTESFRLPDDADAGAIRATFDHGTLQIHAPRRRVEPREVPIEAAPKHLIHAGAEPC